MRAVLIIAALLLAVPAQATSLVCLFLPKMYPTTCQVPAPAQTPAPEPPAAAVAPIQTAPPVVAPLVVMKPRPKPLPRIIRPKYKPAPAKARRRAASIPSWCAWVPAGTPIARMQTEAKSRGIAWTPQAQAQALACLNSKKS